MLEYPRVLYHPNKGEILALSQAHHAELGEEWFLFPNFTNGVQAVVIEEPETVEVEEVPEPAVNLCHCGKEVGHRGAHLKNRQ